MIKHENVWSNEYNKIDEDYKGFKWWAILRRNRKGEPLPAHARNIKKWK